MSGVMLAVVVLIPLAAFEAVQILPASALAYAAPDRVVSASSS
jgi:hypothetical protein